MPLLDMRYNYRTWDNTEVVTVTMTGTGGTVAVEIPVAGQSAPNKRDVQALGLLQDAENKVWLIPDVLLNPNGEDRAIRRRHQITDCDGGVWFVVGVDRIEHKTTWRCVCQGGGV